MHERDYIINKYSAIHFEFCAHLFCVPLAQLSHGNLLINKKRKEKKTVGLLLIIIIIIFPADALIEESARKPQDTGEHNNKRKHTTTWIYLPTDRPNERSFHLMTETLIFPHILCWALDRVILQSALFCSLYFVCSC